VNVAIWIVQGLLAVAFVFAGTMKLTQSHGKLAEQMGWPEDFSPGIVKLIGGLELLGGLGLILPSLTGMAPVLTPIAAVGLAVIQLGAVVVHRRRGEIQVLMVNLILIALLVFVAWGRFGEYAF
jgi:uncharacterized membrane protein YphA (DoxX/SURF4 family)